MPQDSRARRLSKERPRLDLADKRGLEIVGFWRLLEIHRLISDKTYPNCGSLSRHLEVHRRTVERDIERLRDLFGAPIEFDRKRGGYCYGGDFSLPLLRLREGEMIALFLGQKLLTQCRGTPFEKDVARALAKVRLLLPGHVTVDLEEVDRLISFRVDPLRGDETEVAERYAQLADAVESRRTVEMDYYTASRDAVSTRRMDPYHLRFHQGAWYVVGYCHSRGAVRTFALDRIMRLELTEEEFLLPADFSVDEYLADSWGIERGEPHDVAIRFSPEQARYIRGRRWHPSQELQEEPGGSLVMRVRVGGLGEIKRWVMSFGSRAEVLSPPGLREEVGRCLREAAALYPPAGRG